MKNYSEHKRVPLTDKSSGCYLTDAEKVLGVVMAFRSIDVGLISEITHIEERTVRWLLESLQNNDWDIEDTLSQQFNDRVDNYSINKQAYPILAMKGVIA